ncbi:DUF992 domain-containing protein [Bradyrhizobium sp. G127]|jgi:hypothetical protein|uniref:DUF992 domain-containing protein n=1 Tax=Bradyrhizobium sp. G127 TaxID=2904800 RepID=UPI001F410653|nr:DUF992 domain-containing protein [Bradyrhizobium sp. G127]MCF2522274.1 DUF992 domain-containing protein [Bradyrhizobium sp. G127]
MRRFSTILSVAAAAIVATVAVAQSQSGSTQVGVLECRGGPNIGMIVGSVTNLGCVFRSQGRPDDLYTARITKVGVDLGITTETALSWAVFAPTVQFGPGDLSGNYAGVGASATVIAGVGSNALIGGSQNSFALQPLSVQGQTGLSVAGGVQSLELRPGRF